MSKLRHIVVFTLGLGVGVFGMLMLRPNASTQGHTEHEEEGVHGKDTVVISRQAYELANVNVVPVRNGGTPELLIITGVIAQDGAALTSVSSAAAGVLVSKRCHAGDRVSKGQPLVSIKGSTADTALSILSPIDGVIASDLAAEGQIVESGSLLYAVADMSKLQAVLDVYERDAHKLRIGQSITLMPSSANGRRYRGKVIYLSPQIDDATRTMKVRCLIEDPGTALKLGMHLQAQIEVPRAGSNLYVPVSAIYRDGDEHFALVAVADTVFARRSVQVIEESGGWAIIKSGLAQGERVAAGGSFLLRSELQRSSMGAGCAE